jgi:hypothetical protein
MINFQQPQPLYQNDPWQMFQQMMARMREPTFATHGNAMQQPEESQRGVTGRGRTDRFASSLGEQLPAYFTMGNYGSPGASSTAGNFGLPPGVRGEKNANLWDWWTGGRKEQGALQQGIRQGAMGAYNQAADPLGQMTEGNSRSQPRAFGRNEDRYTSWRLF